jgi:hypothetical protein
MFPYPFRVFQGFCQKQPMTPPPPEISKQMTCCLQKGAIRMTTSSQKRPMSPSQTTDT